MMNETKSDRICSFNFNLKVNLELHDLEYYASAEICARMCLRIFRINEINQKQQTMQIL